MIAVVLVSVFSNFGPRTAMMEKVSYSQFLKEVDQGSVRTVAIEDGKIIKGITKNEQRFITYMPMKDDALLGLLLKANVSRPVITPSISGCILLAWSFCLTTGVSCLWSPIINNFFAMELNIAIVAK